MAKFQVSLKILHHKGHSLGITHIQVEAPNESSAKREALTKAKQRKRDVGYEVTKVQTLK